MPRTLLLFAAASVVGCAGPPRTQPDRPAQAEPATEAPPPAAACETAVRDAAATALADVGGQWGEAHILAQPSGQPLATATAGPIPTGPFPPASTVKPFLALAALEAGIVEPDEALPCGGSWTYQGQTAQCFANHPPQTLESALATSCNAYFYELASRLKPAQVADQLASVGLTEAAATLRETTGIPYIAGAIGHGIAVDTAQHAAAYVRLLTSDSPYLPLVLAGMRRTFAGEDGSAHAVRVDGLSVGGKTGTAGEEGEKNMHAWLAAYAPADAPRVLVLAHVYGEGTGATLAGPAVKAALEAWRESCAPAG